MVQKSDIATGLLVVICVAFLIGGMFIFQKIQEADFKYIEVDGMSRSYLIRLPSGYTDDEPIALVIALHGWGGDAKEFDQSSGFTQLAEKENFIVVYPSGIANFPFSSAAWNSGHCCAYPLESGIDDVSFIELLLDHLENQYSIDSRKVYVTGFSNGGMLSYLLGAELSDRVAAIGPVAATIGGKASENSEVCIIPEPSNALSVVAIHGKMDSKVPYEGGIGSIAGTREDLSVNESISFWITHNNCSTVPVIEMSDDGEVIREIYSGGINNTEIMLYSIVRGGHVWPGSSRDTIRAISAAEVIWEFFKTHPKHNNKPKNRVMALRNKSCSFKQSKLVVNTVESFLRQYWILSHQPLELKEIQVEN
ncbi:MAG: alpha/beta hydrolase family esterase [Candidatus Hermodarchaeota archaeon]